MTRMKSAYRKWASLHHLGDPDSAADEARSPPRSNAKRPIFDPLGGPQDPAPHSMPFFDSEILPPLKF